MKLSHNQKLILYIVAFAALMIIKVWARQHTFKTYDYTPWWIYPASAAFIAFGIWEIKTWQKEQKNEKDAWDTALNDGDFFRGIAAIIMGVLFLVISISQTGF